MTGGTADGGGQEWDESRLPPTVRVWLPAAQGTRGPAPAYSRDQIADAAIVIADEQGFDAVSMRRVAAQLGTGAMSLYRYVENKDALHELMLDRMLGREPLPERTGDWRADLRAMARNQRASYLAHPWLHRLALGRPSMGPNMLRTLERAMSIVDGLGLGMDDMLECVDLVNSWVNGFVHRELSMREAIEHTGLDDEQWQHAMGAYVRSLAESGDYPYLARIMDEAEHRDDDTMFEHGLDRLIAGIEATLP